MPPKRSGRKSKEERAAVNRADISVKCPFFKETLKSAIKCEGLYGDGTSAVLTFFSPSVRRDYQRAVCGGDFRVCKWAKTLSEKYGE